MSGTRRELPRSQIGVALLAGQRLEIARQDFVEGCGPNREPFVKCVHPTVLSGRATRPNAIILLLRNPMSPPPRPPPSPGRGAMRVTRRQCRVAKIGRENCTNYLGKSVTCSIIAQTLHHS